MIKLTLTGKNNVITTVSEKEETTSGPNYHLKLTNCQDLSVIDDIVITDISLYPERYNEFTLGNATLLDTFDITTDTTLDSDTIYFCNCVINVAVGVTLTIPADTYIIQNYAYPITNYGTIVNDGAIISGTDLYVNQIWWNSANYPQIPGCTYLFTLKSGWYDYEIASTDNSEILEIGKLLNGPDTYSATTKTYTSTQTNVVYRG